MKNKLQFTALGLLLLMGISALGLTLIQVGGLLPARTLGATLAQPNQAAPDQTAPNQNNAAQLAGDYSGVVKLQMTVAGQFSDTLPTQPISGTPDLGIIDLALSINQTGNALSGYVSLDKTLVFSVEHTIQKDGKALKIGPTLNGNFDGTTLTLLSERVATTLGERSIQRQFWISGTLTQSDGSQFTGQYRETIWGVAYRPVTVIGSFTLQRPAHGKNVPESSNKAPETVADSASTAQGAAVTIQVLANDSDANNDTLTLTSVSKPQFGTATINGQSVVYTPNANFVGSDSFSYFVSDGKGGTAAGSVTVTVNGATGPNQSPTASNDTAATSLGSAVIIDVLLNDSDPNGDALLLSIDAQPASGTAIVENGKIVYTPKAGFSGSDTFTYIVSDGKGGTATATVTVNVGVGTSSKVYLPVVQR